MTKDGSKTSAVVRNPTQLLHSERKPWILKIRAPLSFTKEVTHSEAGATPGKAAAML